MVSSALSSAPFATDLVSSDLTCSQFSSGLISVKIKVTLRLTVSQSVRLGVEPHLGLMTRYLLLFDSYALVFVGRPL
jgi:hypothetical protein